MLLSVGRKPVNNLEWKQIEELKTEKGAVIVDDFMQTSLDKIYAIGDLTGKLQLAHTASKQGLFAVEHIASRIYPEKYKVPAKPINYINIPGALLRIRKLLPLAILKRKLKKFSKKF